MPFHSLRSNGILFGLREKQAYCHMLWLVTACKVLVRCYYFLKDGGFHQFI